MRLYFFKQKALDLIQADIKDNLDYYQADEMWIDDYYASKEKPKYYFDTGIDVPDYELTIGGPETDFQNAKALYEAFSGNINAVQASDLRLWAYLAHVEHWDYMRQRWNIDVPDQEDEEEETGKKSPIEKAIDRVGTRYFFGASKGKAFVRQGIARLYWSAYLTYDADNENGDPYEYTQFFFSKQDIFTSITERSYARNKTLILAALKELKQKPELTRDETRAFLAKLNQAGAITVFDYLDKEQAEQLCGSVMEEIVNTPVLEEGNAFKAIDEVTGRSLGPELIIRNGFATALGKEIMTKPRKLTGKKEGSKFVFHGKRYIIQDIKKSTRFTN